MISHEHTGMDEGSKTFWQFAQEAEKVLPVYQPGKYRAARCHVPSHDTGLQPLQSAVGKPSPTIGA